jgi:hypothetical protein
VTAATLAPHGLGLRLPPQPPATPAGVTWKPWQVNDRAQGHHVSREAADGSAHEFVRNEVGAVKVFRKRDLAQAVCDARNGAVS